MGDVLGLIVGRRLNSARKRMFIAHIMGKLLRKIHFLAIILVIFAVFSFILVNFYYLCSQTQNN